MKRIYLLMFAIMTFTMIATAQESEQNQTQKGETNWGVAYVADFDAMDYGMWGLILDGITPNGWGSCMRVYSNLGINGVNISNSTLLWKIGTNYTPVYTNNYGFYIPMLLNVGGYFIEDDSDTHWFWGLSLEPTVVLRLGGLNLSVGLDVNWSNIAKKINTGLAFGVTF